MNNRGLTLIEVLAALALISIIIVFASSLQIFSAKQYSNQKEQIDSQTNIRLATNIIMKEIRSGNAVVIEDNTLTVDGITYKKEGSSITKNGHAIVTNIQRLDFKQNIDQITITIESLPDNSGNSVSISTNIIIRRPNH